MPTRTWASAAGGRFRVDVTYTEQSPNVWNIDRVDTINETDQLTAEEQALLGPPAPGQAVIYRNDNGSVLYQPIVQPGAADTAEPSRSFPESIRRRIVIEARWPVE